LLFNAKLAIFQLYHYNVTFRRDDDDDVCFVLSQHA